MNNTFQILEHVAAYVQKNPHAWNAFQERMGKALHGQYRAQRWLVMMTCRCLLTDPRQEQAMLDGEDSIQLPEFEGMMEEYRRSRSITLDLLTGDLASPDKTSRDDGYRTAFTFSEERCKPLVRKINACLGENGHGLPTLDEEDLLLFFLSLPLLIDNLIHHIEDMGDAHAMLFLHFLFRGGLGKLACCVMRSRKIPLLVEFVTGVMAETMGLGEDAGIVADLPAHEALMKGWARLNGEKQSYVRFCYKLRRFVFDRREEFEAWHSGLLDNKEELFRLLGLNMARMSKDMPAGQWGGLLGLHFLKMLDGGQPRDDTFETCHRLLQSPMLADRLREGIERCDRHTMFMLYWMIFGNAFTEMAGFLSDEAMHDKAPGWQILMGSEGIRSLVLAGLATKTNTKKDFIEAKKGMTRRGRKAVASTFEEFAGKPGNRMTCLLLEEMLVEERRAATLKAISSIMDGWHGDSRQSSRQEGIKPSVLLPCLQHVLMEKGSFVPGMVLKEDGDKKQRTYQAFVFAMAEKYPEKGFKVDKSASGLHTELQEGRTHFYHASDEEVRETMGWLREVLGDGLTDDRRMDN